MALAKRPDRNLAICTLLLLQVAAPDARGESTIEEIYPAGGRAGSTFVVAIWGPQLEGMDSALVEGESGLSLKVLSGQKKMDETNRSVIERNCGKCHVLKHPGNRGYSSSEWESIVEEMVTKWKAKIPDSDVPAIVSYLQSAADAAAGIRVEVRISPDAMPGIRQIRLSGKHGVSSAFPFEVGVLPETLEIEPNTDLQLHRATPVNAPTVLNGRLYFLGDKDLYTYEAEAGKSYDLVLRPFVGQPAVQEGFLPYVALYDEERQKVLESNPLVGGTGTLKHKATESGTYLIEVRDVLFRGGRGYVYRLSLESSG